MRCYRRHRSAARGLYHSSNKRNEPRLAHFGRPIGEHVFEARNLRYGIAQRNVHGSFTQARAAQAHKASERNASRRDKSNSASTASDDDLVISLEFTQHVAEVSCGYVCVGRLSQFRDKL